MRNFLVGLIVGLMLATSHLYPNAGIVTNVDHAQDTVTVTTQNGHMWEFYGAEDWMEGDVCAMLMNDMGTPCVTDDEIVSAQYCGTAQAEPSLSLR
jgi:hypothetical protein